MQRKADPEGRVKEVKEELDYLLSVQDIACKLTDMYNEGKLPPCASPTTTPRSTTCCSMPTLTRHWSSSIWTP